MVHTNNISGQAIHGIGSILNQETPITNWNTQMVGVVAVGVVAQDTQGPASQPEPVIVHGHGEAIPNLVPSNTPLLAFGHAASAPLIPPVLALEPIFALPVAPASNVDPDVDMGANTNTNPTQSTLMGSFHGVGGIQFADGVPAGQNDQEPMTLLDHAMPNQVAFPHPPLIQLFAVVQAAPAVTAAVVVQPFVPAANDNPVQQPLLRSLRGFEGIEFEGENESEDH
ncbi:hypothetical protein FRC10_008590 [Ceratobasidium sp. 414]|nr:hypothetical protein FRC10_008590 [Ceratobasidium sp. 414]